MPDESKTYLLSDDTAEGIGGYNYLATGDKKEEKSRGPVAAVMVVKPLSRPSCRPLTSVAAIDENCLAPFLNVADRSRLARTSLRLLNFVTKVEQQEKKRKGDEFKRKMIAAPMMPHKNRDQYRLRWGQFFSAGGLIARTDYDQADCDFPILSKNGKEFLNLRGICRPTMQANDHDTECCPVLFSCRLVFSAIKMPISILQFTAIMAGCVYGSYKDYQWRKKIHYPPLISPSSNNRRRNASIQKIGTRMHTALKWADDCNPCGSQASHPASFSLIEPPIYEGWSEWGPEFTCITAKGECLHTENSIYNCSSEASLVFWYFCVPIYMAAVAAPCILSSCVGLICGYTYETLNECRDSSRLPHAMLEAPAQQNMR